MKAFIMHDDKVLIIRESSRYTSGTNIGKYDVIGGSVQPGEHFMDCLKPALASFHRNTYV